MHTLYSQLGKCRITPHINNWNYRIDCRFPLQHHYIITLLPSLICTLGIVALKAYFLGSIGNPEGEAYKESYSNSINREILIIVSYSVNQSDRNSLKTDTFHKPANYEPLV